MTVCKFWRQGYCKNGDRCRFEHPPNQNNSQPPAHQYQNQNQNQNQHQNQSHNRYVPLGSHSTGFGSGPRNNAPGRNAPTGGNPRDSRRSRNPRDHPYGITQQSVKEDLTGERPQWLMSAYGPGKDAPVQLFGGLPLEQSFEEVRVQHYLNVATGVPQQTVQLEQEFAAQANQQVQNALNDLDGAIDYIVSGAQTHPNRLDVIAEVARSARANQPQRRGDGVFSRSNARPLPSAPSNARNIPSGPSGFQSNPNQPAFGGQSFVQHPQSFNQASTFGQSGTLTQGNQLGAPSGFGTAGPFGTATFGASSQINQPNSLIQPAPQQVNGFGQSIQQPNVAPFGQNPSMITNAFVPPQQQQIQQQIIPATFGQQPASHSTGVFGRQDSQIPSLPFEQPAASQVSNSPFGGVPQQPTGQGFGQPPTGMANGGFGPSQTPQQNTMPFAQPNQNMNNNLDVGLNTAPVLNGFPNPAQQAPPSNTTSQPSALNSTLNGMNGGPPIPMLASYNPDLASYSTRDANGRLLSWKGRPVSYIEDLPHFQQVDGFWERIWFPDGPPSQQANHNHLQPAAYTDDSRKTYEYLMAHGSFQGHVMPEVPPPVNMARWDV